MSFAGELCASATIYSFKDCKEEQKEDREACTSLSAEDYAATSG